MNLTPLFGALALVCTVACASTNKTPDEPAVVPSAGAAPVAVAPASSSEAQASEPKMSAKMDVTHEAGKLHYVASGGRSPFEKIECSISWGAGGEGASTTAVVVARPGRFKDVKQAGQPEAEALRASLREVFTFDPMSLDEEQVRVPATDLNTYTLDMTLGASSRTVTGYGLVEGSEFAQLIRGMDEICGVSAAISEARGS